MQEEAIGYTVLKIVNGIMKLETIPFGRRTPSGVEALSAETIDEIYCQYLEVDGNSDLKSFMYQTNEYALHFGVPRDLINDKPTWLEVVSAKRFIVTLFVDNKPQVFNNEGIILVHNLLRTLKGE